MKRLDCGDWVIWDSSWFTQVLKAERPSAVGGRAAAALMFFQ